MRAPDCFEHRLLSVEQDAHGFVAQLNRLGGTGSEAVTQVDCRDEDLPVPDHDDRVLYLLLKRRCASAAAPLRAARSR